MRRVSYKINSGGLGFGKMDKQKQSNDKGAFFSHVIKIIKWLKNKFFVLVIVKHCFRLSSCFTGKGNFHSVLAFTGCYEKWCGTRYFYRGPHLPIQKKTVSINNKANRCLG